MTDTIQVTGKEIVSEKSIYGQMRHNTEEIKVFFLLGLRRTLKAARQKEEFGPAPNSSICSMLVTHPPL